MKPDTKVDLTRVSANTPKYLDHLPAVYVLKETHSWPRNKNLIKEIKKNSPEKNLPNFLNYADVNILINFSNRMSIRSSYH